METVYFALVAFLIGLAVFDLFVGVSNDAVNFMQSAVGARVASYRTVLIVASVGVIAGAVLSQGMMDVARHGVIQPGQFALSEVMVLFMGVMVANILVLDAFNALGMPTSTTVSLVFALLGGAVALAIIKMLGNPELHMAQLINTDKALQVIIAIFVSVAIAFFFGLLVQWLVRLVFTFHFEQHQRYTIGIFGGLSIATLSYFIFLQGLGKSPFMPAEVKLWVDTHTPMLLAGIFVAGTILSQLLHNAGIGIFKMVVLMGTFALAMAFAGNDLVNFIGVPLAGLDAVTDYHNNNGGLGVSEYMMHILATSASTPTLYLFIAGSIMVMAMVTSKKAKKVIQTGIDLSRQDEGDEMFGSSLVARSLVRTVQNGIETTQRLAARYSLLGRIADWSESRFAPRTDAANEGAAFDVVRAAVNLVLAAMLITVGTNLKLPLSTTYVTFMVAMGSSLADRAWKRESAVFRITGVISVIGGWFVTAGASFVVCALVAVVMYYGGIAAQIGFIILVVYLLIHSQKKASAEEGEDFSDASYRLMMHTSDPGIVWELLRKHIVRTQSEATRIACEQYAIIIDGFMHHKVGRMRGVNYALREEKQQLRKLRKQELLAMRRGPERLAAERNTWFHVGINASEQYIQCLRRMLEPILEHVDNNFTPLPQALKDEYAEVCHEVMSLMQTTEGCISTKRFEHYRDTLAEADNLKDRLSRLRRQHTDRMQRATGTEDLQVSLVYLNLLQETQQFLSNMRHQLRAAKKFLE